MASATTPIFKPMADCFSLLSLPAIFTSKPTISYLPIQPKPFRLQLSYSHSAIFAHSPLSLKKKTLSSSIVAFVAQQEDSTAQVVVEEEEEEATWENQELDASGAPISDWESEGEDASVKAASGEEIGEGFVAEEGEGEGEGEGEVFQEPSEDAKIFIGNLPYDVDSESLAQMFQEAGSVEIAEVIYNRETDQSRGFGFVTMSTVEEAEKAVEMFNRYMVNGRPLTVNKAAPRGSRAERPPRVSEPAIRIYVGNLPWDVDNSRLEQIFSEHGKVVEARVVFDRETGRSRGFGFVTMSSQTEMNDAIAALDGESLEGRPIRVNVAEERPRRNFF